MIRSCKLPLIPGYSFNSHLGQTRFHKSQHFEHLEEIPILSERVKPGIGGVPLPGSRPDKYPSAFARGEVNELPAWLVFDKQVLRFDCYFQETVQETAGFASQIRRCKILFFLEDGTIQVMEPKVRNSGLWQGTFISRQRIRFPAPRNGDFYDLLDINVGKDVELYGRVFHVTDCDVFTRSFLNRIGISVPDPVNTPEDEYAVLKKRQQDAMQPRKPKRNIDTLGQFLEFDRKVLRFGAYWDDRESDGGLFHNLELHYYLADDTIEIKDDVEPNTGRDEGLMFLRRCKLPKYFKGIPGPGSEAPQTALNVFSTGFLRGHWLVDRLNCGREDVKYYNSCDLAIGGVVNVYGRKVMLTDCDPFTKEFYLKKYGVDIFIPHPRPADYRECEEAAPPPRVLPPWNGYGSYEDSAQNCVTVEMKAPHGDFVRFLQKDRSGVDSHILRFAAEILTRNPDDKLRDFVISLFLSDDTISIHELARRNTGFTQGCFLTRGVVVKPGEEIFASAPPKKYTATDLYIGNVVDLHAHRFRLTGADEYALHYMEQHCDEFPLADVKAILAKVRAVLPAEQPRELLARYFPQDPCAPVPLARLRSFLCDLLGEKVCEHEVVTLGRQYNARLGQERHPRDKVRSVVHNELCRGLFDDFERLEVTFRQRDPERSGYLDRATVYSSVRGANLPLDRDLVEVMLDKICVDDRGRLSYCDLLRFIDYKRCPAPCSLPTAIGRDYSPISDRVDNRVGEVDIQFLIRDLGLEAEGGKAEGGLRDAKQDPASQ